jgi:hypothetical protein
VRQKGRKEQQSYKACTHISPRMLCKPILLQKEARDEVTLSELTPGKLTLEPTRLARQGALAGGRYEMPIRWQEWVFTTSHT